MMSNVLPRFFSVHSVQQQFTIIIIQANCHMGMHLPLIYLQVYSWGLLDSPKFHSPKVRFRGFGLGLSFGQVIVSVVMVNFRFGLLLYNPRDYRTFRPSNRNHSWDNLGISSCFFYVVKTDRNSCFQLQSLDTHGGSAASLCAAATWGLWSVDGLGTRLACCSCYQHLGLVRYSSVSETLVAELLWTLVEFTMMLPSVTDTLIAPE